MDSSGKVAIVTGAGSRRDKLDETAKDSGAGARALVVPTDVTDQKSVRALFAATKEKFGRLDVLFNNAGIGTPGSIMLEDLTLEQWQAVVNTNLTGMFLCTQEAFKIMKSQTPRGGPIINNGSDIAHAPRAKCAAQASPQHAVPRPRALGGGWGGGVAGRAGATTRAARGAPRRRRRLAVEAALGRPDETVHRRRAALGRECDTGAARAPAGDFRRRVRGDAHRVPRLRSGARDRGGDARDPHELPQGHREPPGAGASARPGAAGYALALCDSGRSRGGAGRTDHGHQRGRHGAPRPRRLPLPGAGHPHPRLADRAPGERQRERGSRSAALPAPGARRRRERAALGLPVRRSLRRGEGADPAVCEQVAPPLAAESFAGGSSFETIAPFARTSPLSS